MRRQRAQAGEQLAAVAVGEVHVDEGEVDRALVQQAQRVVDVGRAHRLLAEGVEEALDHHAVDLVVLDHQHAVAGGRRARVGRGRGGRGLGGRGGGRRQRDLEAHRGALPRRALQLDRAAHGLDQAAAHRQPEAGAGVVAAAVAHLHEGLEDLLLARGLDADAVVLDGEVEAAGLRPGAYAHGHRALVAELDRVADQVEQDLAELAAVALHRVGQRGIDLGHQREPAHRGARALHREDVVYRVAQAERHVVDVHAAGLDAGEVEHVLEQLEQQYGRGAHLRLILRALGGGAGVLDELEQAEDARERGAQLVADGAEEGGLGAVGLFGGVAGAGVVGGLAGERGVGLAQLRGARQHLVLELLLLAAQRLGEAVALDGVGAEAFERDRERGQLVVAGGVDGHLAPAGGEREGGLFERTQAPERVAAQRVDGDAERHQQQRRGDHAEGDQPRGGAALGG